MIVMLLYVKKFNLLTANLSFKTQPYYSDALAFGINTLRTIIFGTFVHFSLMDTSSHYCFWLVSSWNVQISPFPPKKSRDRIECRASVKTLLIQSTASKNLGSQIS